MTDSVPIVFGISMVAKDFVLVNNSDVFHMYVLFQRNEEWSSVSCWDRLQ